MTDWMDDALCSTTDPNAFFPEAGGENGARARSICARCEVVSECLEYALSRDIREGIWGNTSPKERAKMRKAA